MSEYPDFQDYLDEAEEQLGMTDAPNELEQAVEAGFSTSDGAYGLFSKADIRGLLAQNRRYAEALHNLAMAAGELVVATDGMEAIRDERAKVLKCLVALNPIGGSSNG